MMTPMLGRVGLAAGVAAMAHLALTQQGTGVRVCVGADRVLRAAPAGACPAGQTAYVLAEAGAGAVAPGGGTDANAAAQIAELKSQLKSLTQRVSDAEKEIAKSEELSAGQKVIAPFTVVDKAGKPIFTVRDNPRGFVMTTASGKGATYASALETGGVFKAMSADGSVQSVFGVNGQYAAVELRHNDVKRAWLALNPNGKTALSFSNDDGTAIAYFGLGDTGGGYMQLGSAGGQSAVDAGITADNRGFVIAYPKGNPGAGLLGLPGTFLIGRK